MVAHLQAKIGGCLTVFVVLQHIDNIHHLKKGVKMPFEKGNTHGNRFNKEKQPRERKPRGKSKMASIVEELKNEAHKAVETKTMGKKTKLEVIAAVLMNKAMGGDMKAISMVMDRLDGRAPEEINHNVSGELKNPMGGGAVINIITNEG